MNNSNGKAFLVPGLDLFGDDSSNDSFHASDSVHTDDCMSNGGDDGGSEDDDGSGGSKGDDDGSGGGVEESKNDMDLDDVQTAHLLPLPLSPVASGEAIVLPKNLPKRTPRHQPELNLDDMQKDMQLHVEDGIELLSKTSPGQPSPMFMASIGSNKDQGAASMDAQKTGGVDERGIDRFLRASTTPRGKKMAVPRNNEDTEEDDKGDY